MHVGHMLSTTSSLEESENTYDNHLSRPTSTDNGKGGDVD